MATISQLPAEVTLRKFRGDELNVTVDFDVDLSGYTLSNDIYRLEQVAIGGGVTVPQAVSYGTFTTTVLSAADGQVRLTLDETASGALVAGAYRWYLRWVAPGSVTRTILNGTLEVVDDLSQASGVNSDGAVIIVQAAEATTGGGGGGSVLAAAGLFDDILWG